jgi:hypothetical protein
MNLAGPLSGRNFDLIFSSNMLEHLEDPVESLRGMLKLLDPHHGVMVHVMPNKVWKTLQIGLSLPDAIRRATKRASTHTESVRYHTPRESASRSVTKRVGEIFWPAPHGVASSNFKEFGLFGRSRWLNRFDEAGVRTVCVKKLFAHSPYRWGWETVRGVVTAVGIVSSLAYIGVHPDFEGDEQLSEWLSLKS